MPHLLQGPPTIPDNFPMYENWENLTHQGESFTISYRQQIYEARSEIITTLINCFSELNKYTSSHPETELACHQEKTRHFSYYSWLVQHIDNVLQEDNIFRRGNELPELPAPTYSPSCYRLRDDSKNPCHVPCMERIGSSLARGHNNPP